MIENRTILERAAGRPAQVKLKGVKLIKTIRVTRVVDGKTISIRESDFDSRLHKPQAMPQASTEVAAPALQTIRHVEMNRALLSSMTLEELRALPQWSSVSNAHLIRNQPEAVTALLVAAGLEEEVKSIEQLEKELLEGAEEVPQEAPKKAAPKKSAPKAKSDDE